MLVLSLHPAPLYMAILLLLHANHFSLIYDIISRSKKSSRARLVFFCHVHVQKNPDVHVSFFYDMSMFKKILTCMSRFFLT